MNKSRRFLALFLSFLLLGLSFGQAHAAIIANNQVIHQIEQTNDRAALLQTINRKDVQVQLIDMGVNLADIESRINQMTHEEIAQLNHQLDTLPAGGGVVGVIVLVFVVFVITDVIGATDIFPFIHPVN